MNNLLNSSTETLRWATTFSSPTMAQPIRNHQRELICRILAALLLASVAAPAWAASYVYVPTEIDGPISVFGTTNNAVVATLTGSRVALTPDGAFAYLDQGASTNIVDTRTNTVVQTLPFGFYPVFAPDGATAYFILTAESIAVMSTANKTVVATIEIPGFNIRPAAVTPNGQFLYVFGDQVGSPSPSSTVFVIATATNSVVGNLPVAPGQIAFSKDGAFAYIAQAGQTEQLISNH
jgi:hypothetical protein